MNKVVKYLEFIGTEPKILKNTKLFKDHPFYSLSFVCGEKKKIVNDVFTNSGIVPESVAIQYAKYYRDFVKIVSEEVSDDDCVSFTIKDLATSYGVPFVRQIVMDFFFPEGIDKQPKVKVTKPKNTNARKKSTKSKK